MEWDIYEDAWIYPFIKLLIASPEDILQTFEILHIIKVSSLKQILKFRNLVKLLT